MSEIITKKCLITGAGGFVGQNLRNYLFQKKIACSAASRTQLGGINGEILNKFNTIIHLAGKAHDLKQVSDPEEYYEVNYELTRKIYDAFLISDAEKFIFVSSVKAVADVADGILTEETTPNPQTHYGKSKLMAEEYIQSQSLPEGKSYYILRPCMIHGPGNKGNLNLLYQFVQRGFFYPLAAFENKRSFLSVENLCFVIHEIITQDIKTGIYHLADDEALSTNEVISILAETTNKKTKLLRLPVGIVRFLSKIGDKLSLPLNTERLNKLTENFIVSNHKIKYTIQKQLPLSVREGLVVTCKSFKKENN